MMMIQSHQHHTTVEVPRWDIPYDDPTAGNNSMLYSPQTREYFSALQRYLPSLNESLNEFGESDDDETEFDSFCCDEFRMFEFKVRKCNRGSSHDWTQCPFAHPAEKARRRDPRRYQYSGTACPEFRRGTCRKGDSCEYAHGVFECWLHPARYRTQPCKDGSHCKRRVCFFAHSPDQLRVLPNSSESPPSQLVNSPPMSPPISLSELVVSMQGLKLGSGLSLSPRSPWGIPMCGSGSRFGSPRSPSGYMSGFCGPTSSPSTPTRTPTRSGLGLFDLWDLTVEEEEPVMERVESGKDLRARIYSKLSKENSLDGDRVDSANQGPDFEWVCDIVK